MQDGSSIDHLSAASLAIEKAQGTLVQSNAYGALDANTRSKLTGNLDRIRGALQSAKGRADPYSNPFAADGVATEMPDPSAAQTSAISRIPGAVGALSDEVNFPDFVASLVHGTFDAVVDASIKQMEAFAELVSVVAKDVNTFMQENVTPNQVRDWLVERYPEDLALELPDSTAAVPRLRAQATNGGGDGFFVEAASPAWLADYDLAGEELTDDLIEGRLVPAARRIVAENRMQHLATMVLLGLNRVRVDNGLISARIRIRAAGGDRTAVDYASQQDAQTQQSRWGRRGSNTLSAPQAMVSTVGVNVQAESQIQAELFGEVRLNFSSETVPLERFADAAMRSLLERRARPREAQRTPLATAPQPPAVTPVPQPPGVTPAAPLPPPAEVNPDETA